VLEPRSLPPTVFQGSHRVKDHVLESQVQRRKLPTWDFRIRRNFLALSNSDLVSPSRETASPHGTTDSANNGRGTSSGYQCNRRPRRQRNPRESGRVADLQGLGGGGTHPSSRRSDGFERRTGFAGCSAKTRRGKLARSYAGEAPSGVPERALDIPQCGAERRREEAEAPGGEGRERPDVGVDKNSIVSRQQDKPGRVIFFLFLFSLFLFFCFSFVSFTFGTLARGRSVPRPFLLEQ
jgi:hypothetical protein